MTSSKKTQRDVSPARAGFRTSGVQPKASQQTPTRHPRPLLLLKLLDERRTGLLVGRDQGKHIYLPVLRGVPMITANATVSQWRRWLYHCDGPLGFRNAEVEAEGSPAPVLAWVANGLRTAAMQRHAQRVVENRGDAPLLLRGEVSLRPLQLRAAERLVVEIIRTEAPSFASLIDRPTVDPQVARSLVFILSAFATSRRQQTGSAAATAGADPCLRRAGGGSEARDGRPVLESRADHDAPTRARAADAVRSAGGARRRQWPHGASGVHEAALLVASRSTGTGQADMRPVMAEIL